MIGDFFELLIDRTGPQETVAACALRLADMLGEIGDIQTAFTRMIVQRDDMTGRSARYLPIRADEIVPLFAEQKWYDEASKRRRSDGFWLHAAADFSPIEPLAFGPVTLDVRANAADPEGQWLRTPTWVSISFSAGAQPMDRGKFADLVSIFCAVIDAWQPDRGGIFSSTYRQHVRSAAGGPSFWNGACIAFLSDKCADRVSPPTSALKECRAGGTMLAAVDGPFDAGRSDHISAADALSAALRQ